MKVQRSKMTILKSKRQNILSLFMAGAVLTVTPNIASAQDAVSYGGSLAVPVFEQVDQNGVDLLSGYLRIQSPTIVTGTKESRRVTGLQWTGQGWTHMDVPSIWKDGRTYTVNHNGRSEEFNDYRSSYSQKKPITGSKLSCLIWSPGDVTSGCIYYSRDGEVVIFRGIPNPYVTPIVNVGVTGYPIGNLGMFGGQRYSDDLGDRLFGLVRQQDGFGHDQAYFRQRLHIAVGQHFLATSTSILKAGLNIETPNHNDDNEDHFLRPKGTVQTISDDAGSQWRYTINNHREMTYIQPPGGAAGVTYNYNDQRVTSVVTPDGTWTYSHSTPGAFRTVTRTDPHGKQVYVKSHDDKGHIVEYRDELSRTTFYQYDGGDRLQRVTYPEGNKLEFTYDARGNITAKKRIGKSGQIFIESATYQSTCEVSPTCNQPLTTTDAKGNITNYEYAVPRTRTIEAPAIGLPTTAKAGPSSPTKITLPAPGPGKPRPQIRNTYIGGLLSESSLCKTAAACAGTADEVKTKYIYHGTARSPFGVEVTSNGQTLRTCYGFGQYGRIVSETPPRANLASCEAPAVAQQPTTNLAPTQNPRTTPTYPGITGGGGTPPGGGGGGGGGDGGCGNVHC